MLFVTHSFSPIHWNINCAVVHGASDALREAKPDNMPQLFTLWLFTVSLMHGNTRCRQTNICERTGITTSGLLCAPSMNVFVGLWSTGSLVRRLSPSRMSGLLADRFLLSQWKKYLTIVRWQWRQVMLFFFVSSIALFRLQPLCLGHRRRSCIEGMGVSSGLSLIGMEPHGVPVWQECRIPSTDTAAIVNTSFMGASPFPPLPPAIAAASLSCCSCFSILSWLSPLSSRSDWH